MFRFFETRIDPFRAHPDTMPPASLIGYYLRFCGQVWPYFVALMAIGLVVSLIEVEILRFVGALVDILRASNPRDLWRDHGREFVGMGLLVLIGRPLAALVARPRGAADDHARHDQHDPLADASLCVAAVGRLFRQRFRRPHRLEHRAGGARPHRLGGADHRRALVRHGLRAERAGDFRRNGLAARASPGDVDLSLYRDPEPFRAAHPVPFRAAFARPRDPDRPDRRQLRQHPDGEAVRPPRPRGRARPRGAQDPSFPVPCADASRHAAQSHGVEPQQPLTDPGRSPRRLAVDARVGDGGRHRGGDGSGDPDRDDVGLGDVDLDRHLPERRSGSGGDPHGQRAAGAGRSPRRHDANRAAGRDRVRARAFPLWQGRRRVRRSLVHDPARREGRAGRALGRGKIDAGQPVAAVPRRRGRPHPD